MRKLLCLLLFFLCQNFLFAQVEQFSCATVMPDISQNQLGLPNAPGFSGSYDPAYLATFEPISFNIYFWIINKTDGSNDVVPTEEDFIKNLKTINDYFRPMGICFVLKGYNFINNTSLYNNANTSNISNYAQNNGHVIQNCFNIYVPKTLSVGNGATNYGSNKIFVNHTKTYGHYQNVHGVTLAHELAHTFGLYHTFGNINGTTVTQEHVTRDPSHPDYNALTTADEIHDTPAMAGFWNEVNANLGITIEDIINLADCSYIGSNTDLLGVPFQLTPTDVGNVMGYTWEECVVGFTTGQGIRIREWIANPANANAQCLTAKRETFKPIDLYIKDSAEDFGDEPNTYSPYTWISPSIWVRHQPDLLTEPQNPEYHPNIPNYVHVRIANRGCGTSSGTEQLKMYWCKASPALAWGYTWIGNTFANGALMGDAIGTITIPPIAQDEEIVVTVPWTNIPNPTNYQDINPDPWHFCLLARVVSNNDPMTISEEFNSMSINVFNNNNIANVNLTVVDLEPNTGGKPIGGVVAIGNIYDQPTAYVLEFIAEDKEAGKKIFDEAEVSISLDPVLLNAWVKGGKRGNFVRLVNDNKLIVTADNASLDNIIFDPKEIGTLNLQFNFLTKEITAKEKYTYHILQKNRESGQLIGGETYNIVKHPRGLFYSDAGGDKQTDKNEPVILTAATINEPALYNWYDSNGTLVYEGINYTVSVAIGEKYKLEVIALADGYKDYSEIEIKLKPNSITTIFPNPTVNQATVTYKINEGDAAYLSLNPVYGASGVSQNYILDIAQSETTLDLSAYPIGTYLVTLVTNGQIADTNYLVKQ